jgi:ribonuclease HI
VCFEFDFLAVVDGGALSNGAENRGYGSYQLSTRDGRRQTVRLDLGTATNNEAEYRTLIAALKDLIGRITLAGKSPARYSVVVQTDAQLLVGQLTQGWQVKAANLRPLVDEAAGLLKSFGLAQLEKVPREEIVRVLGH